MCAKIWTCYELKKCANWDTNSDMKFRRSASSPESRFGFTLPYALGVIAIRIPHFHIEAACSESNAKISTSSTKIIRRIRLPRG